MNEIFSAEAPKYWAHNIPVIPLRIMQKRPFHDDWTRFCHQMPTERQQDEWVSEYRNYNIGLPLGPQSNIMIIDVDTTNAEVATTILKLLPPSPWRRVGAKGCALAYKFNGNKACKIMSANEGMVVEILSTGNQVVLPPSIHPDTRLPYEANCNLYDVIDELVPLPTNMEEILRTALSAVIELKSNKKGSFKTIDFVPAGARDVQMVRYAGLLSSEVLKGDCTFLDAVGRMIAWCDERVAKVHGDDIDVAKGISKIVEFILNDITVRGKILPPRWDLDMTPEDKLKYGLDVAEDQQEWTQAQINDYINAQFSETAASDPKRFEIVQYVLRKIAKSSRLDELEIGKILTTLKDQSGLGLPISHYNKELKRLRKPPVEGENHTEIATEIQKYYTDREQDVRFQDGLFWVWNGVHWQEVPDQELRNLVAKEFGSMLAAKKSHDHKGIIDVLKNIVPQRLSEGTIKGVNFQNGFLTKDLKLLPHAPEQGMTYVLKFNYNVDAAGKCPMFFNYLHESWGHNTDFKERTRLLQESLAVTLFGMAAEFQRVFLLYGVGNTGKSILLDLLEALTPKEAQCALPPSEWNEKFTNAQLAGKILNRAGELPENGNIPGAAFKTISVGEAFTVQDKNGKPFPMHCKAAHWFASNYLPSSRDVSSGFNRRWNIFTYDKVVKQEDRITEFGKKLVDEEVEAIVAWAVQALPELIANSSYTFCPSSVECVDEMALKNSPVRQWIRDRIIDKEGAETTFDTLYRDYWAYCASGMASKPPTPAAFRTQLQQMLAESSRFSSKQGPNGEIFSGITLKPNKK